MRCYMGNVIVVDGDDRKRGIAPIDYVHSETNPLRHRASHVLVFRSDRMNTVLVARISDKHATVRSRGKLHVSAGGHVEDDYFSTALSELGQELFYTWKKLPSGITLAEVATYRNDTAPTNKENARLFCAVYPWPFSPHPNEVSEIYWKNRHALWKGICFGSVNHTKSLENAMKAFKEYAGDRF